MSGYIDDSTGKAIHIGAVTVPAQGVHVLKFQAPNELRAGAAFVQIG